MVNLYHITISLSHSNFDTCQVTNQIRSFWALSSNTSVKVKIVADMREDKELTGKEEKEILNQKDFNWKKKKFFSSGSVLLCYFGVWSNYTPPAEV